PRSRVPAKAGPTCRATTDSQRKAKRRAAGAGWANAADAINSTASPARPAATAFLFLPLTGRNPSVGSRAETRAAAEGRRASVGRRAAPAGPGGTDDPRRRVSARGASSLVGHRFQPRDPLADRRVRAEEVGQRPLALVHRARQRIVDAEVGGAAG